VNEPPARSSSRRPSRTIVRGRRPDAASALAMVLFPVFSVVLANLVLMTESKQVKFCGSCHETMGPIAASLDAEGDSARAEERGARANPSARSASSRNAIGRNRHRFRDHAAVDWPRYEEEHR
jgi:hypothetical protein